MSLQLKLNEVSKKFKDGELKVSVNIAKMGAFYNRKEGLQIIVNDVSEPTYIAVSAQVQTILRDSIGYGMVNSNYDFDTNKINIDFIPIEKERVASIRSNYHKSTSEPVIRRNYSTAPGCTDLNKF